MQHTTGITNSQYVSPLTFVHDPEIYNQLFDPLKEDDFISFFERTGRTSVTNQEEYHHFEQDFIYQQVTFNPANNTTPSGAGAGNPVNIVIEAASHERAGTLSPLKANDLVIIWNVRGFVQSKNTTTTGAHEVLIRPQRSADDLIAAAAAASPAVIRMFSNAHAEGTGGPASSVSDPVRYSNNTQIFRNRYEVTGTEATNKIEFNVDSGDAGIGAGMYYYYKGVHDSYCKFKKDKELQFLLGVKSDGLVDTNNGGTAVNTTRSLEQYIDDFGIDQTYVGSFDRTDMYDVIKLIRREFGPKEYCLLAGSNLDVSIDNEFNDQHRQGTDFTKYGSANGKHRAIDLNFDTFEIAGHKIQKKYFQAFDHPNITAVTGAPYPDMGFFVPLHQVMDNKSNEMIDSIGLRYKDNGEQNRMYKHWVRPQEITGVDKTEYNWQSDCGLQVAGARQFVKVHL